MDVDVANEGIGSTPLPHDILWYTDGDVVLATDTFLFKVHKFILSMQSSVFRDMFAFPAIDSAQGASNPDGEEVQEMYEGLPMVVLAGDKGEEVVHLLRTLYERDYYYRDNDDTPLETITALLVLSTKYDFRLIRSDVIHQVSKKYPMSLEEYVYVDDDYVKMFGKFRMECHFPLLCAFLKADVECLLPPLYYACSDFPIEAILFHAKILSMDPQSMLFLIGGRDIIKNTINELIATLPDQIRENAVRSCASFGSRCCTIAHFSNLRSLSNSADLRRIAGKSVSKYLHQACDSCEAYIKESVDRKREKIWYALPSLFGLRGWEILKEELAKLS
ncbi:hypothetical protein SCHPADRAFT_859095 [Schizopora paradoxa]|uniref:BTB domain-containing protein n=1 Tax=Schizopora paradoxa TaxID=27342 RepID=A0A0H2RUD1_9AGAM|nr:hypothetical protein SCHPADRAFT_859095 [Schizopora paradoxa]